MPQDGSNNYQYPPGTPGVPDTTIESEAYNTFLDDLVQNDLNIPRPVHRGGTGGETIAEARANLEAEVSGAQVTNYDAHVFENGSFYSNPGATGSPDATKPFWGYAYGIDANNIQITARYGTELYNRAKVGGVWGAWDQTQTLASDVVIDKANPSITLDKGPAPEFTAIYGTMNGHKRWVLSLGNSEAETGDNLGTSFSLQAYDDADALRSPPALIINRSEFSATMGGSLTVLNNLTVKEGGPTVVTGQISFGNTANRYLRFDGTDFHFSNAGGHLKIDTGDLYLNTSAATAAIAFGNLSGRYLSYDGTDYRLSGGHLITEGTAGVNGHDITARGGLNVAGAALIGGNITSNTGYVAAKGGMYADAIDSGQAPFYTLRSETLVNFGGMYYARAAAELFVIHNVSGVNIRLGSWGIASSSDNCYRPAGGPWIASSDARIKTVHGDYTQGLDAILALHPVLYSYIGNDSFGKTAPDDPNPSMHSTVVGKQFVGLIAQECEVPMPEMVAQVPGFIDGQPVTDLRTLDTGPLVFALINAVKTLTARIEQLEAAAAAP